MFLLTFVNISGYLLFLQKCYQNIIQNRLETSIPVFFETHKFGFVGLSNMFNLAKVDLACVLPCLHVLLMASIAAASG